MPIARNRFLELLPRKDRNQMLSRCELIQLVMEEVLYETDSVVRHVYFPTDGFVSLVTSIGAKPVLEVGMVGAEGMLGAFLATGVPKSPNLAVVQGSGGTWRASAADFRAALRLSAPLHRCVDRYLYVLMGQLMTSARCLRFHTITQRLARWLLMTQDRACADSFAVTHVFLGYMLGVRREGITEAAGDLQRSGLIEYTRGILKVMNRSALEAAACDCYEVDQRAYADVLL